MIPSGDQFLLRVLIGLTEKKFSNMTDFCHRSKMDNQSIGLSLERVS